MNGSTQLVCVCVCVFEIAIRDPQSLVSCSAHFRHSLIVIKNFSAIGEEPKEKSQARKAKIMISSVRYSVVGRIRGQRRFYCLPFSIAIMVSGSFLRHSKDHYDGDV